MICRLTRPDKPVKLQAHRARSLFPAPCSLDLKAHVVLEELVGVKDTGEACRDYRLRPQVFPRWREECLERYNQQRARISSITVHIQTNQDVNVQISVADVGETWQNGYDERLIRTIKEEEVDHSEYIDYNDTYRRLGRFPDGVHMHKRVHSSLGYLTAAELEEQ